MLSAESLSIGPGQTTMLRSDAILVRNTNNQPIFLIAMVGPQMYEVFSVLDDRSKFINALQRYGVDGAPEVDPNIMPLKSR